MLAFLQAALDGLLIGGVYAVISIGLTLVFGVMGIINFAQAEFLMLGMFVAYFAWAWLGLDPLIAAPIAFIMLSCECIWAHCLSMISPVNVLLLF